MSNNGQEVRTAYIYSRVSKTIQATHGEGISRQIDKAHHFIEQTNKNHAQKGLPLYQVADELIIDQGLSAYIGANTANNAMLGAFLEAARNGKIPENSLLVVEAVDRISRLPSRQSRAIFNELAEYKIDVAIVKFNLIVKHDEEGDLSSDLLLTVGFYLAHMESQQKSERIRATFDKKRRDEKNGGEKRTNVCPAWMRLSEDKKEFLLIEEHTKVLKRIFDMRIKDNATSTQIKDVLNREGILNFKGKLWNDKLITKYLKMEQTIGRFQPHTSDYSTGKRVKVPLGEPIDNYYPSAISDGDFALVQASFSNVTQGERSNSFKNLFNRMLKCPHCGSSLSYAKSNRGQPKLRCRKYLERLGCSFGKGSGKKGQHLNYQPVEDLLVRSLACFDYRELLESKNDQKVSMKELDIKIADNTNDLDKLELKLRNTKSMTVINVLTEKMEQLESELDYLNNEKVQLINSQTIPTISDIEIDLDSIEGRSKYNAFISRYVNYIIVDKQSCIIVFKGKLGNVRLYYEEKHHRKLTKGKALGRDIVEAKIIKKLNKHVTDIFQIDLDDYVSIRNARFSAMTSKIKPQTNDLLSSIKFVFEVCVEKKLDTDKLGMLERSFDVVESINNKTARII